MDDDRSGIEIAGEREIARMGGAPRGAESPAFMLAAAIALGITIGGTVLFGPVSVDAFIMYGAVGAGVGACVALTMRIILRVKADKEAMRDAKLHEDAKAGRIAEAKARGDFDRFGK